MTDSQSVESAARAKSAQGGKAGKPDRRSELLEVARKLFLQNGYDATSVSAIVREAGVAQGTFYLYFKSKQTVLAHLRVEVLHAYLGAWDGAMKATQAQPADARLVAGLHAVRDAVYEHRDLVRLFREATTPAEQQKIWLAGRSRLSEPLKELLEAGQADGCFTLDDARMAAQLALAMLDDLLWESIEFDSPAPLPLTSAHGTRFLLRAFRCDEARVCELVPLPESPA